MLCTWTSRKLLTKSITAFLRKLRAMEVSGYLFRMIQEYLSGRKQHVFVEGWVSEDCDVSSGLPQGSLLGPLLFLVYINDMPEALHNLRALLFLLADDSKVIATNCLLSDCIIALENWALDNKMYFHPTKSQVILLVGTNFEASEESLQYFLHAKEKRVNTLKHSGQDEPL